MALVSLLEPFSFFPYMPYRSRTNPSFTKQAHLFRYHVFTKYNQQRIRNCQFQPMRKLHSQITCHLDLKPDCLQFKNKSPNHVQDFLQMASESAEPLKKLFISVVIGAIPICYSYEALAASGGAMGGDCFSCDSSSSSSSSFSDFDSDCESDCEFGLTESPSITSSESNYTMSISVAPQTISPKQRLVRNAVVVSIFLVLIVFVGNAIRHSVNEENLGKSRLTSVIKLQVALLGSDRLFQRDLNQIAELSNTTTQKGLKSILTESSSALLRHFTSCVSSHLSISEEQSVQNGEVYFKRLSFEERRKFDQETLVNLDTFKKKQELRGEFDNVGHDFIVVTFLVAVVGILKLPSTKSRADLKAIVQKLESMPEKEILAVQVLWTPQDDKDTLSSQRVLKDYPLLKPLND